MFETEWVQEVCSSVLPSRPIVGATQPLVPYNVYRVVSGGIKRPGLGVRHPLPCSAQVAHG